MANFFKSIPVSAKTTTANFGSVITSAVQRAGSGGSSANPPRVALGRTPPRFRTSALRAGEAEPSEPFDASGTHALLHTKTVEKFPDDNVEGLQVDALEPFVVDAADSAEAARNVDHLAWTEALEDPEDWVEEPHTCETCRESYGVNEEATAWQPAVSDVWAQEPPSASFVSDTDAAPTSTRPKTGEPAWREAPANVWSEELAKADAAESTSGTATLAPPVRVSRKRVLDAEQFRLLRRPDVMRAAAVVLAASCTGALVVGMGAGGGVGILAVKEQASKYLEDAFRKLLVTAPSVFSFMLQCSGLSAMRQIVQDRQTGDLSPFTFVSMFTNCTVWCTYALLISDMACFVPNFTGALFGAYYTKVFSQYTVKDMRPFYLGTAAVLGGVGAAAALFGAAAAPAIGLVGAASCVVLLASPLSTVKTVFETKSTSSMVFSICFASFWNSLSWVAYGAILAKNPLIIVPNALGLVATIMQLSLFVLFPAKPKFEEEEVDFAYMNIGKTA